MHTGRRVSDLGGRGCHACVNEVSWRCFASKRTFALALQAAQVLKEVGQEPNNSSGIPSRAIPVRPTLGIASSTMGYAERDLRSRVASRTRPRHRELASALLRSGYRDVGAPTEVGVTFLAE